MSALARMRAILVGTATILVIVGTVGGSVPTSGEGMAEAAIQAEAPADPVWNATFGRSADDRLNAIVPADDGYLLIGETDTAGNGVDGWLIRIDETGDPRYSTTFGGPGEDRLSDAVATEDGYLLAGWRMADDGGTQGWLLKIDDRGAEQWSRTYGGPQWDGFWEIAEGTDGEYVAVGRHQATAWAVAVDGDGDEQWTQTYGSADTASTFTSVAATDEGYLFAGWRSPENGTEIGTAARVDESGDEQWNRSYGAEDGTRVASVTASGEQFALAGVTDLEADQPRAWAALIGDDGSVETQWTDELPGSRFLDSISVDDGFLFVGGADRSDSGYDTLTARFDGDLDRQWETIAGGSQWDMAFSGTPTDDGYFVCGATSSAGAGGLDGWLVKLEDGEETDS